MRISRFLTALIVASLLTSASAVSAQGKLNVVTTTEDLAAIAREIGGDRITVESIARGYQDPHFVEAKPSFILKLQKADLLIVVGRELEIGVLGQQCLEAAFVKSMLSNCGVSARSSSRKPLSESDAASPSAAPHAAARAASSPASPPRRTVTSAPRRVTSKIRRSESRRGRRPRP